MGKLKTLFIGAAAVTCALLMGTSTTAGGFLRGAAYFSAGSFMGDGSAAESGGADDNSGSSGGTSLPGSSNVSNVSSVTDVTDVPVVESGSDTESSANSSDVSDHPQSPSVSESSPATSTAVPVPQKLGKVITKNRTYGTDDVDYSQFTENSGSIDRYNFGYFNDPNIITLSSGAQLRNCTDDENADLLAASEQLPSLGDFDGFEIGSEEPQVLIYHTHTSESFLPYGDSYDADYPIRSGDCTKNMTAVGDAICKALAERGISSVHDCTVHDYPIFTGAYYRSEETILEVLEEYPSIKIAIDIHRDGIITDSGSVIAPIAEINGNTAAQFMIITGCNSPETVIPNYMQNFKLACLLQNCAEISYPGLARPVLFDYRNYNQSLFEGCLLIEVGSQGNTLEEALYTGDLLGDIIADAIERLAEQ